ncbi:hypothetical protein [Desulforamulus aquiferis]|uniref:Uncharacterized protein n=1 Tax=Desulforamulus aquiferis TaxID=1397668 RepID=A0AAW7ZEL6_9FIRM|nr:hypothetical protein [Desulforamulus aquiferis]MDO7788209.1 hypothetical protein [Desulforamulus aquiferis]
MGHNPLTFMAAAGAGFYLAYGITTARGIVDVSCKRSGGCRSLYLAAAAAIVATYDYWQHLC